MRSGSNWRSLVVLLLFAGLVLAACGPTPEPQVVEKVVTQVVKETVIVAGTPQVVEKEVTVVPEPTESTAAPAAGEPKYGGTLLYAVMNDPSNWTPYNTVTCLDETLMSWIWSSLVRYDAKGELVGDVAESWEWLDDTTIVFHLRQNVKWHNGKPLTADDVVKSMTLRMQPTTIEKERMEDFIDKWEAIDDYTVKLTLKEANISVLRLLTPSPGHGVILPPDWDPATSGQSAETTIGTGPFMYESYEPGVGLKLVRNPDYFIEGLPYLDAIEVKIIADDETRLTALRAGEVDMIEYVDFQSLPMLREDPNYTIPEGLGFYGARLMFELTLPPTDDVLVRQAFNFAIDRQMMVDAVFADAAVPIWGSLIPEGHFGYAPELANYYSYDPAKAVELLAEAGWTDTDGDGMLDKDGQPMQVVFATYGPSWWSQVAELVQANLKAIGVDCQLDITPWAEYAEKRQQNASLPEGEPGMFNIIGGTIWGLDIGDFAGYVNGSMNRYNNPAIQAKMSEALAASDDAKREELFREAQAMVMEDAPWMAPVWIFRGEALRNNVKGFEHLNETACYGILLSDVWLDNQ